MQARGATIPGIAKKLGISEQTFNRSRIKYGALKEDEAQRLKALEAELIVGTPGWSASWPSRPWTSRC
ncbi:hypothetical protein GCM10028801_46170 [Nocardioides maradonensis]